MVRVLSFFLVAMTAAIPTHTGKDISIFAKSFSSYHIITSD